MQAVTHVLFMIAAASLTPGPLQLLVWCQHRAQWDRRFFYIAAAGTSWLASYQRRMLKARLLADCARALRWIRLPVLPEDPEILFQPFHPTKTEVRDRGMGMGRAICCSMVTAHPGQIRAAGPDHGGAVFYGALPTMGGLK